ncbi:sugar phosphate transporter domain-containing protein [Pseudoscourfieldia marina]
MRDRTFVVTIILLYAVTNSQLLVINKLCVTFLKSPHFVLLFQLMFSAASIRLAALAGLVQLSDVDASKLRSFSPVVFLFYGNIASNMKAIQRVPLDTFVCLRSSTPLVISMLEWYLLGRRFPSLRSLLGMLVIVLGVVQYVRLDVNFDYEGYAWIVVWYMINIADMIWIKHIFNNVSMTTWERSYYQNLLSIPLSLTFLLWSGEFSTLLDERWAQSITWLSLSCVVGVAMSYLSTKARELVSAASFAVLGNICKLGTIFVNTMMWDVHATSEGLIALLFAILGCTVYQQAPLRKEGESLNDFSCPLALQPVKKQLRNIGIFGLIVSLISAYMLHWNTQLSSQNLGATNIKAQTKLSSRDDSKRIPNKPVRAKRPRHRSRGAHSQWHGQPRHSESALTIKPESVVNEACVTGEESVKGCMGRFNNSDWYENDLDQQDKEREVSKLFDHSRDHVCNADAWHENFIQIQRGELSKPEGERRLLIFSPIAGLGDRAAGIVTSFLFAMLTGRAFLISWENFGTALYSPYLGEITTKLLQPSNIDSLTRENAQALLSKLRKTHVEERSGPNVAWIKCNRGLVYELLNQKHPGVLRLGLMPDTAYGCILNFLLQPIPSVLVPFLSIAKSLASKATTSVGIQIRVAKRDNAKMRKIFGGNNGARSLIGTSTEIPFYLIEGPLLCAKILANEEKRKRKKVVFFVMSDSHSVRKQSTRYLGKDNVHVISEDIGIEDAAFHSQDSSIRNPYVSAVVESWLFGVCDKKVFSYKSGLGRFASTLNLKNSGNVFPSSGLSKKLDNHPKKAKFKWVSSCVGSSSSVPMSIMASTGAGL